MDGKNGFTINSGAKIQSILDINGDNLQDLLQTNLNDDKTYLIFGSKNITANLNFDNLDRTNIFAIALVLNPKQIIT